MIAAAKMMCANGGGDLIDQLATGGEGNSTAPSASASASAGLAAASSALADASAFSAAATGTPTSTTSGTSVTAAGGLGLGAGVSSTCPECDEVANALNDPVCKDKTAEACLDKFCAVSALPWPD